MIPMVDLKAQYETLKDKIEPAMLEALANTQFILGPNVQAFEKEAAQHLNAKHAITCASGTDALHLALVAAGIGAGDEVITTAFTFIATAEAICYVGATPVFVDILPDSFNIDPTAIASAITNKTKAILPVHLFGQPANMTKIMQIAKDNDLLVIEDCAQSFAADINKQNTGTFGQSGCHSFFPSKNLGCYGDGGMVTTEDDDIANKLIALRNHGSYTRYHHDVIGFNSRLDELQAVILREKLRHLTQYNNERRRVAHRYSKNLQDAVTPPAEDGIGTHVYHQYTLLSDKRDAIHARLTENKIASAIYYPIPLHKQNVFKNDFTDISLPVTDDVTAKCLSLPIHPELSNDNIDKICDVIKSVV